MEQLQSVTLTGVPEESKRALFDAFALMLQYHRYEARFRYPSQAPIAKFG
jgi:hypothetical protein